MERKQKDLEARWETLTGRIGEGLEGPMNDLLAWILNGVDGLGQLDVFLGMVEEGWRKNLAPLAAFADGLRTVLDLLLGIASHGFAGIPGGSSGGGVHVPNRPGVSGGTGGERTVIRSVQDYQERNGKPII